MGHVTPGYEFAVVDKDTGELCAEGETGELWLRGTRGIQLFLEYFDNPEANEKAFEDGWFKTGDMVMLGTGGNLFYRSATRTCSRSAARTSRPARSRSSSAPCPASPRSRSSASTTSSSTRWSWRS